ncbi:MAG: acetyltransferase [Chloroflexi bacterium]|nr:acetyltransferase [Chloroflexota bacterium]
MSKVVIFGTGRGADVAYRYLMGDSPHKVVGFTLDKIYLKANDFHGLPALPFEDVESRFPPEEYKMFVPLGFDNMNQLRYEKYMQARQKGYEFVSYAHSAIPRIEEINMGENCFILENQSINLDVKIGNNVIIWSGNQIGDSTEIMDHCWISSHVCISGNVVIKPFCVIGVNATISHNVTIEEKCFIGANALISKDTQPKGVYIVPDTNKAPLDSDRFFALFPPTK